MGRRAPQGRAPLPVASRKQSPALPPARAEATGMEARRAETQLHRGSGRKPESPALRHAKGSPCSSVVASGDNGAWYCASRPTIATGRCGGAGRRVRVVTRAAEGVMTPRRQVAVAGTRCVQPRVVPPSLRARPKSSRDTKARPSGARALRNRRGPWAAAASPSAPARQTPFFPFGDARHDGLRPSGATSPRRPGDPNEGKPGPGRHPGLRA